MNKSFSGTRSVIFLFIALSNLLPYALWAQKKKATAKKVISYVLQNQITLPGNGSYDELFIDQPSRKLYVSHGTIVQVVDLDSSKLVATLGPLKDAHSIAVLDHGEKGFITDGKANNVLAFDTRTFETLATIPLTGKGPHSIIHDPNSNVLFTFNWGSRNASIVDPIGLREYGTVDLGGNPEIGLSNANGLIYTTLEDRNQLVIIDTKSKKVFQRFPLTPCGVPTALAYDALNERMFTGCRENKALSILNALDGKTITTLPIGEGVGAVAYDPETKLILVSCSDGTLTVIKQKTPDLYTIIQTLSIPVRSRSFALDLKTSNIYVSTAEFNEATQQPIPATFKVLVYSRKADSPKTLTKR